jgi:hypothetical protein
MMKNDDDDDAPSWFASWQAGSLFLTEDPAATTTTDTAAAEKADGVAATTTNTTTTTAAAVDGAKDRPNRRRYLVLSSLLIGLILIAGGVALSLTLTRSTPQQSRAPGKYGGGAQDASIPTTNPSSNATNPNNEVTVPPVENNETSSQPEMDQDEALDEDDKGVDVTDGNDGEIEVEDGDGKEVVNSTMTTTAAQGPVMQKWPEDPFEFAPEFEMIFDEEAPTTIVLLDTGETVQVRWPECVGMGSSECEQLVRATNPYITIVQVNEYGITAFQNTRVWIAADENGIVIEEEPRIG